MIQTSLNHNSGFGLTEALVSVFIFGLVLLSISSFNTLTFGNLGLENKISASVREARNAINLLSTELRMSSTMSPYIPGNSPALVDCADFIEASNNMIKFLVVHDDYTATNGIQPYYVGYLYDSDSKTLLRGEIPAPTTTTCSIPAGDPTSQQHAKIVAQRVSPTDIDDNGVIEPIFHFSDGVLNINLEVAAFGPGILFRAQKISTRVYTRSSG
jgi:Tfp pilus assembly protein PilW